MEGIVLEKEFSDFFFRQILLIRTNFKTNKFPVKNVNKLVSKVNCFNNLNVN